jgi:tetratricopeptide (TPR) repeat protein
VNIVRTLAIAFLTASIITSSFFASALAAAMTTQAYEAAIDKLFMNTQFSDAQQLCSKAMAEHPKDRVVFLLKMAEMYIVAAKGRSGLEAGRNAARLAPKNAQVVATGSILEFLAGFVVKAEQMAQSAVALDDKNGRAHAAMALSGLRVETISVAEELEKAMKLAPKDATVMVVAGMIHLRRLEYDQAEKTYSLFVKTFPNTALPYYQRGFFRREVFNNNGAIKDFGEVLKRYKGDHFVLSTRAKLNKKTGHFKEAIEDFNALEKLGAAGYTQFSRRAECYAALNDYEAAIKDYKLALKTVGVNEPNFHKKYATTFGSTRRSAWTQMMDGKDASEFSDTKSTWLKMIMLEEKHGDYADALQELIKFTALFPGDLNSIFLRQSLYKRMHRYAEALGDINLLISKNPNVAEYYASRADIYKLAGKPDRAAQDLKRVHNLETTGTPEGF